MTRTSSLCSALRAAGVFFGLVAIGFYESPLAHAFHGDLDLDTYTDAEEVFSGSDGTSPLSTPESLTWDSLGITLGSCSDAVDNDCDGFADAADLGCLNSDGDVFLGSPLDNTVESSLGSNMFSAASTPEH